MVLPVIRGHKLDGYLLGKKPCPPAFLTTENGAAPIPVTQPNPEYEDWVTIDQLLLGWLLGSMSESVLTKVVGLSTSHEVWNKLETVYANQSMANALNYRQQLQRTVKGSMSIDEYLTKMKNYSDQMGVAGQPLPLTDLVMIVLAGLDRDYDSTVSLITHQKATITWSDVESILLTQESRIEQLNAMNNVIHSSANVVTMNKQGNHFHRGSTPMNSNYYSEHSQGRGNRPPNPANGPNNQANANIANTTSALIATPDVVGDPACLPSPIMSSSSYPSLQHDNGLSPSSPAIGPNVQAESLRSHNETQQHHTTPIPCENSTTEDHSPITIPTEDTHLTNPSLPPLNTSNHELPVNPPMSHSPLASSSPPPIRHRKPQPHIPTHSMTTRSKDGIFKPKSRAKWMVMIMFAEPSMPYLLILIV
ncbi:unnamed protein product [Fraxinus pennsylvanica]|uniref:Uncharacterized protein n=1 Tax=Fraxinus pennsylvanica TaxID=56036 RepID=A0AAD2EAI7_9LAMI|nr:unnamed protein product [Fraxinus pennsylvanica]